MCCFCTVSYRVYSLVLIIRLCLFQKFCGLSVVSYCISLDMSIPCYHAVVWCHGQITASLLPLQSAALFLQNVKTGSNVRREARWIQPQVKNPPIDLSAKTIGLMNNYFDKVCVGLLRHSTLTGEQVLCSFNERSYDIFTYDCILLYGFLP